MRASVEGRDGAVRGTADVGRDELQLGGPSRLRRTSADPAVRRSSTSWTFGVDP
jgi:hypothetical protein